MTGQQAFERYIANAQRINPKWDGWTEGKISNRALGVHYEECLPSRDLTWKRLEEILGG
jgi:hypothetical protein